MAENEITLKWAMVPAVPQRQAWAIAARKISAKSIAKGEQKAVKDE